MTSMAPSRSPFLVGWPTRVLGWLGLCGLLLAVPGCATGSGGAKVLHFADCQAGAAPDCVPGKDSNPGTEAAPKRSLSSVDLDRLPAGTQLLFKRGGAWSGVSASLYNLNATPESPIVFDAYGSGPAPVLGMVGMGFGFSTGYGQTRPAGGYVLRNLVLDGGRQTQSGITASKMAQHLTIENVTIRRFMFGLLLHDFTVSKLTLRNSVVRDNVQHGLLGGGNDWTIEGNTFEGNGDARPPSTHALYFSASGNNRNLVVRNNTFRNNSQRGGACASGNLTVHGTITGALIEGNRIESSNYVPGCRGISITAGYPGVEYMRNFVVRGNTVRNSGACIAFNAAPGIVIEGNRCMDHTANAFALIENPRNDSGGGDDEDGGAVIRNNIICGTSAAETGLISGVRSAAALAGNVVRARGDARTGACAF